LLTSASISATESPNGPLKEEFLKLLLGTRYLLAAQESYHLDKEDTGWLCPYEVMEHHKGGEVMKWWRSKKVFQKWVSID
jgi:hypothetical protein